MIARTRQKRSRSPRRSNDILRAMASSPAGLAEPLERERVTLLANEDSIDFQDPTLALAETPTAQTMREATPRLAIAREHAPVRPPIVVRQPYMPDIDLTAAQKFVDPCRLPRTPPRNDSPERSSTIDTYRQVGDVASQDIVEDFREVRTVLHSFTPRQIYLLQQGIILYQCRQFCLMPCHRCVAREGGIITYRCQQCIRPRLPELRCGTTRMHHECLCSEHFPSQGSGPERIADWVWVSEYAVIEAGTDHVAPVYWFRQLPS